MEGIIADNHALVSSATNNQYNSNIMKIAIAIPTRTFLCFITVLFKYSIFIRTDEPKNCSIIRKVNPRDKKSQFLFAVSNKVFIFAPVK